MPELSQKSYVQLIDQALLSFSNDADDGTHEIHNGANEKPDSRIMYPVFGEVDNADLTGRDAETRLRLKLILDEVRRSGALRPIAQPQPGVAGKLVELGRMFPNFSQVVEFVAPFAELLSRNIVMTMPPVLLLGPPGVGKTHFAQALADVLRSTFMSIDMAAETNAAKLSGSSVFWSNSAPGALFTTLLQGAGGRSAVANPVILVDEIDKAGRDLTYDPLGSLYTLLEKRSARRFEDQAVPGLKVDASHVRWIFTANNAAGLPEPIQSRMVTFEIKKPSIDQQRQIVQRIAADSVAGLMRAFDPTLTESMLNDCDTQSPREVRLKVELALALAMAAGHDCITDAVWNRASGILRNESRTKLRVGFV